jgi:phage tail sheath protein FI
MGFQVSPGVEIKEIDLSNVVPAISTSLGATAGAFNWGPVSEVTMVSSEKELASTFGGPDDNTASFFWTAASFLKYSNALKVVRVATTNLNATASGTGVLVKNKDHYEDPTLSLTDDWIAKYPGLLGNSLKVSVCPAGDAAVFAAWAYEDNFDNAPTTSTFASDKSCSNDEMHVVVVDEDGEWTGTPGTVLDIFPGVSQASDAKNADGSSNYYKTVLNSSKYVWWGDDDSTLTNASSTTLAVAGDFMSSITTAVIDTSLSGGTDDNAPTLGEMQLGFDMFADSATIDVNLLFTVPGANTAISGDPGSDTALANYIINIAQTRKDCVAFLSPPIEDTVNETSPAVEVKAWADQLTSSSYGFIDSSALYMYDKYNDTFRWIPAAGHMAGLCANTDKIADPWYSPAGYDRGQLRNVTKLAFNPDQADRDTLYKARINPLVAFPGQGKLLFGDKTAQAKPSSFDRINVRRLFIVLEKAIATAAKYQLFEFNDDFTRAQFRNMVEPFLRDVKGRRGITDFAVVCDGTNNTGQIIDTNQFVADIYIKPARSINFITLSFIATRSDVEFSEIIGQ